MLLLNCYIVVKQYKILVGIGIFMFIEHMPVMQTRQTKLEGGRIIIHIYRLKIYIVAKRLIVGIGLKS